MVSFDDICTVFYINCNRNDNVNHYMLDKMQFKRRICRIEKVLLQCLLKKIILFKIAALKL